MRYSPAGSTAPLCLRNSPVYDELVIGSWLVTHWAHPGRLLLVHLEVEDRVEALQVGTGLCPAGHGEPHLHQLGGMGGGVSRPPGNPNIMHRYGRGTTTSTHWTDEGDPDTGGGDLTVGVQAKLLFDCEGGGGRC